MIELKLCPFCGGEAEVRESTENGGRQYHVGCTKCSADVGRLWFWKMSDVIEAWNSRAEQIPKEPIYSDFEEDDDDRVFPNKATCPMCGHEFEFGTWNDGESHHCVCGQRIKW